MSNGHGPLLFSLPQGRFGVFPGFSKRKCGNTGIVYHKFAKNPSFYNYLPENLDLFKNIKYDKVGFISKSKGVTGP
jgi:hypothetical protein